MSHLNNDLLERYSRHIMLENFDLEGQERLNRANCLIIGMGGLGTIASLYLASSGVGQLTLCDDDTITLSNLQRQILYTDKDINKKKVSIAKKRLLATNPHCKITAVAERLSEKNSKQLFRAVDIVLDCSDNFATRHLVNRLCFQYNTPLVFAAAIQFDGQVSVFNPNNIHSPCYNCLFDETSAAEDTPCALLGVLAPALGIVGSMQASEAIKMIAMPHKSQTLIGRLILIDALNCRFREVNLPKDPHCTVCNDR